MKVVEIHQIFNGIDLKMDTKGKPLGVTIDFKSVGKKYKDVVVDFLADLEALRIIEEREDELNVSGDDVLKGIKSKF